MVLRTDGRIVAMSDEIEHHLGKSMVNILQIISKQNSISFSVRYTRNA